MDYEVSWYKTVKSAIEYLETDYIEKFDTDKIKMIEHYTNQAKAFLIVFSDNVDVWTSIKRQTEVKDIIEAVVNDFVLQEEGNLIKLAVLFENVYPEIYEEITNLSDIGIENYITNPKNPNHHIVQEVIFNLINPKKIIVINS